jgi:acyl carrier protein
MSTETANRIIAVLQQVFAAEHVKFPARVAGNTKLISLGLNSLLFIKFIVRLEVEFDIDFDDENMDIKNFVTFNDIVAYVEQQSNVA